MPTQPRRKASGRPARLKGRLRHADEGRGRSHRDRIDDLYQRISADPRHTRVTRLVHEPIAERSFRDWTMGLIEPTPADLAAVPGLAPLVAAGGSLADLDTGQARALLDSLARGPLRLRCETAMVRSLITTRPGR